VDDSDDLSMVAQKNMLPLPLVTLLWRARVVQRHVILIRPVIAWIDWSWCAIAERFSGVQERRVMLHEGIETLAPSGTE